jgi:single-stranded DNA-binding protein
VYLEGMIQSREYEDSHTGDKKYTTEVVLKSFNSNLILLDKKNGSEIQNDTKSLTSILKKSMEMNSKFDSNSILAEKKVIEQQQHLNHMLKLSEKVLSLNSKSKTEIKANIFQRLFKVFWL